MKLSDLTAYAEKKYHIGETYVESDTPGYTALVNPHTRKWAALLMRQPSPDSRMETERCDIRCGWEIPGQSRLLWLTSPFRMKGDRWVGVTFNEQTDAERVYRMLDAAMADEEQRGYTITLENKPADSQDKGHVYHDTLIEGASGRKRDSTPEYGRIREMKMLEGPTDHALPAKSRMFIRQGKLMADYETLAEEKNVAPASAYARSYAELNVRQLQAYFVWRTKIRRGIYTKTDTTFVFIYLMELINLIGTAGPQDSFEKLIAFRKNYLEAGLSSEELLSVFHHWVLDLGVTYQLPAEEVYPNVDPAIRERDDRLITLKNADNCPDEAVYDALLFFDTKVLEKSAVVKDHPGKGKHLYAEVWRMTSRNYIGWDERDWFTECFGERRMFPKVMFPKVLYVDNTSGRDIEYDLNPVRNYTFNGREWLEYRYDRLYFEKDLFQALLQEAERKFRIYLKTGRSIKEDPDREWADEYIDAVIEADRKMEKEASRKQINIDFSGLDKIRKDAEKTKESLLTESEMDETADGAGEEVSGSELPVADTVPDDSPVACLQMDAAEEPEAGAGAYPAGLDETKTAVLRALLEGAASVGRQQLGQRMPSVVTDEINEALFDEIGDNVLECDGDEIVLVEDYREDLIHLLGMHE